MSQIKHGADIEALVNRQMRLWETMARSAQEPAEATTVPSKKFGPYVTISRFVGTGGDEIAKRVADKLGWQVFDREIVEYISSQSKARESIVSLFDEKVQNELHTWVENLFTWSAMDNEHYLRRLSQVIYAIARHGNAVIVGRGANFIVPAHYGLRVRIVAPEPWRVEYLQKQQGLSEAEAREKIKTQDEMQREFIKKQFHQNVEECTNYDIVLNAGVLGLEHCADIITENVKYLTSK